MVRSSMTVQSIAVIGAGQMGNGIVQVAACADYDVVMIDIKQAYLDKGLDTISKSLEKFTEKGKISENNAENALNRISIDTSMESASAADLVIEAIPEIPELKFSTFSELDRICKPSAILSSNTSSISIDDIANATTRPERVIGMHFMNPVPLMQLVEIINGSKTSNTVNTTVVSVAERMGKTALSCNDSPGFVSNRILCPMLNEAIITLDQGVADRDAIDGIMKLGMKHPIGPLALSDLIGLDTLLHIMQVLHNGLGDEKYKPSSLLISMVKEGKLGRKSGEGFYSYD